MRTRTIICTNLFVFYFILLRPEYSYIAIDHFFEKKFIVDSTALVSPVVPRFVDLT